MVSEQEACSGSDTGEADREKKREFAEKRKQHYNEMALVKKMMAAGAVDEDEDDDDDDEGEVDAANDCSATASRQAAVICAEDHVDVGCSNGQWAFGPDDLHGGPKLPDGRTFKRSVSFSSEKSDCAPADSAAAPSTPSRQRCPDALPKKPALRKGGAPRVANETRLVWDEATIAEHDLERGTRQKIEEPNTPWISSPQLSNEVSPNPGGTPTQLSGEASSFPEEATVHRKLKSWYDTEKHRVSIQERWEDLQTLQVGVQSAATTQSHDAFVQKRKQHYNEMDMVRKALASSAAMDDDDEEDEDGEKENSDEKEGDEEEEEKKKAAFAAKRKAHYNEMDLVRKMMAAKLEDEEDEDDDDDDDDADANACGN